MAETPVGLDLLGIFVAVADDTSFSRAARRLGITKGTVSRAIARLEQALGTELIHRTTHRVALSTAGTALYERTAPHLSALAHAVGRLPERAEQPSGDLRLTAWASAPGARGAHPREEHLLPLMVIAGAAGGPGHRAGRPPSVAVHPAEAPLT